MQSAPCVAPARARGLPGRGSAAGPLSQGNVVRCFRRNLCLFSSTWGPPFTYSFIRSLSQLPPPHDFLYSPHPTASQFGLLTAQSGLTAPDAHAITPSRAGSSSGQRSGRAGKCSGRPLPCSDSGGCFPRSFVSETGLPLRTLGSEWRPPRGHLALRLAKGLGEH